MAHHSTDPRHDRAAYWLRESVRHSDPDDVAAVAELGLGPREARAELVYRALDRALERILALPPRRPGYRSLRPRRRWRGPRLPLPVK